MGCIYASHFANGCIKYILLPWGAWKCRGKRAAISCVAARFLCLQLVLFLMMQLCCTMMQNIPRCSMSHGVCCSSCRSLCSSALAWRSHRLAGLALLLVLPAHAAAQTAITDANAGTAAIAWLTNPTTSTTTYGPMADWNTVAVTSMVSLFYPTVGPSTSGPARPTFNGDISKWNVASVPSMYQVRASTRSGRHIH